MTDRPDPDTSTLPLGDPLGEARGRFEAAWKQGLRPDLPDFLPPDWPPRERAALMVVLLDVDREYRGRAGEPVSREAYLERLPHHAAAVHDYFDRAETLVPANPPVPLPEPPPTDPEPPPTDAEPPLPEAFGRYRVLAFVGRGTFGKVYKARDPDVERDVAVKVPRPEALAAMGGVEAWLGEARVLGQLRHPHIVPVYDVGRTDDGSCFLVALFIHGTDLRTRLRDGRPAFPETARLVADVADALHHAHLNKVVHRDVKPANILVEANGTPYLTDFGLALREQDFGRGWQWVGTRAYMSPEQARREGHRVTGSSDIFSLGVVLYEMLTGRRPFQGDSAEELREQILHADPTPPRQRDDAIPAELERICLKALAKRAADRFTTARDLAADLRAWLDSGEPAPPRRLASEDRPALPALPEPVAPSPSPPPVPEPARVVFNGLRSFTARDSDFFLQLLPGPRDRDGLPETVRFWKERLEETDPDATFPVGLLYGPSGCGKSSLVRAGLLPRLAAGVLSVYVEASPDDTEARVLRGLRRALPGLDDDPGQDHDLAAVLESLRRGRGLGGRKVVLVFDQFEQWLHARGRDARPDLVPALRQCDGRHVQALVLVRDDFWMAVTRLFRELEVPLVDGHNSAAVDLFAPAHARKVLAAFGQSLGDLPDDAGTFSADQGRFLDQAVAELTRDGRVVPVRLALFAQMVKDKPWSPATLKALGGVRGVGVTFLEETLASPQAPPAHRLHQEAARGVLKALLPEGGAAIKGHMRTAEDLSRAAGYEDQPADFVELVRILNTELRLITPSGPADSSRDTEVTPAEGVDPTRAQFYQLTHDYLVPSVRDWLNRKKKETRRGRAELQLEELAAEYQRRPGPRTLPGWWDWLAIRRYTRRADWTAPQQAMMACAGRRFARRAAAGALALAALALLAATLATLAARARRDAHTDGLVEELAGRASLAQVPVLADKLADDRAGNPARAATLLRGRFDAAPADTPARRKAALALLRLDPALAAGPCLDAAWDGLLDAPPHDVPVFARALDPHARTLHDRITAELAGPRPGRRLRAAAVRALYLPADEAHWQELAAPLTDDLLAESSLHLDAWLDAFRPLQHLLVPELTRVFGRAREPDSQRGVLAARALAAYLADQPAALAGLVPAADVRQLPILVEALRTSPGEALPALRKDLDAAPPDRPPPDPAHSAWAARRANAALALLALGHDDPAALAPWRRGLRDDPEPQARLIERAGIGGLPAETLIALLDREADPSARRALVLALGGYDATGLPASLRDRVTPLLLNWYEHDLDAGLHAAINWLLRPTHEGPDPRRLAWGRAADLDALDRRLAAAARGTPPAPGGRPRWAVNRLGLTLVIVPAPVEYLMGSPPEEPGRALKDEDQVLRRIDRPFALAAEPVSEDLYRQFLAECPPARGADNPPPPEGPGLPAVSVSWPDAARFCNWLSLRDGLPRDQWCYTDDPLPRPVPDAERKKGYRLPLEVEWEWACRAGAATPWACGRDPDLLSYYAWYLGNSQVRCWPAGQKRPNEFGLFDMHGNVSQWCHDLQAVPDVPRSLLPGRTGTGAALFSVSATRGGSFNQLPQNLRSAFRFRVFTEIRAKYLGFRPARTWE